MLGGHAVKMIGWGTENGTPFWICSNSWNSDWGENGTLFAVRRQEFSGHHRVLMCDFQDSSESFVASMSAESNPESWPASQSCERRKSAPLYRYK